MAPPQHNAVRLAPPCPNTTAGWALVWCNMRWDAWVVVTLASALVVVIVLGNALVIGTMLTSRRLRHVSASSLIASLAVADILVGVVVLPPAILFEVTGRKWPFGPTLCHLWNMADIWMCTASVHNLVAISVDRYVAVLKPLEYARIVTKRRSYIVLALVWTLSFLVSLPTLIAPATGAQRNTTCEITESSPAYKYFSAAGSFFIPILLIVFIYTRIYCAARMALADICTNIKSIGSYSNVAAAAAASPMPPAQAAANKRCNSVKQTAPVVVSAKQSRVFDFVRSIATSLDSSDASDSIRRNTTSEIHRDRYVNRRHDPLIASLKRLKFGQKSAVVNRTIEHCDHHHLGKHALSEPQCQLVGSPKLPPAPGSTGGSFEDDDIEMITSPIEHAHSLNPVAEQDEDTDVSVGTRRSVHRVTSAASSQKKAHPQLTITSEMVARYRTLTNPFPSMHRTDPLKQSIRRLRGQPERTLSTQISFDYNVKKANSDAVIGVAHVHPNRATPSPPHANEKRHSQSNSSGSATCRTQGRLDRFIEKTRSKLNGANTYHRRLSLEIRAARTVAIVTGCFMFCWFGFSVVYVLTATPICKLVRCS